MTEGGGDYNGFRVINFIVQRLQMLVSVLPASKYRQTVINHVMVDRKELLVIKQCQTKPNIDTDN